MNNFNKQLKRYGWTLCSYNYGKNLENIFVYGKNPDSKILKYFVDNPFSSYIDFDDKNSAITEELGVVTAYSQVEGYKIAI